MLPITGYSDRLSVQPGETINFKVSCISGSTFEARFVRIRCGDPNPDGPSVREEALAGDFRGTYPARFQQVNLGSYVRIADAHALQDPSSFTVVATIWPTTPEKPKQGILCKQDHETGAGIALLLNGDKGITAILGDGKHKAIEVSVGKRLRGRQDLLCRRESAVAAGVAAAPASMYSRARTRTDMKSLLRPLSALRS